VAPAPHPRVEAWSRNIPSRRVLPREAFARRSIAHDLGPPVGLGLPDRICDTRDFIMGGIGRRHRNAPHSYPEKRGTTRPVQPRERIFLGFTDTERAPPSTANGSLLDGPGIAARAEFELHARRDVGHALIFGDGQCRRIVEVDRLGVAGVNPQFPLAVGRLAKLFDDRGSERREKFIGNVTLDVADQIVDQPGRLLLAYLLPLGIAIADITEFCTIERQRPSPRKGRRDRRWEGGRPYPSRSAAAALAIETSVGRIQAGA
jgi:hypothetical protein